MRWTARSNRSPDSRSASLARRLRQAAAQQAAAVTGQGGPPASYFSSSEYIFFSCLALANGSVLPGVVFLCSRQKSACVVYASAPQAIAWGPAIAIVRLVRRQERPARTSLASWTGVRGAVRHRAFPTRLGRRGSSGLATPPPARARVALPSPAPTGRMLTPSVSGRRHRVVPGL